MNNSHSLFVLFSVRTAFLFPWISLSPNQGVEVVFSLLSSSSSRIHCISGPSLLSACLFWTFSSIVMFVLSTCKCIVVSDVMLSVVLFGGGGGGGSGGGGGGGGGVVVVVAVFFVLVRA